MNMEQQIDRAVESATNAAAEAYSVSGEAPFIYDKESWADCIADIITDPENDERMRYDLWRALNWMDMAGNYPSRDPESITLRASQITNFAQSIGMRVILNAIKNGVTLENIGSVG